MCYIKWQKGLQRLTKVIECKREIFLDCPEGSNQSPAPLNAKNFLWLWSERRAERCAMWGLDLMLLSWQSDKVHRWLPQPATKQGPRPSIHKEMNSDNLNEFGSKFFPEPSKRSLALLMLWFWPCETDPKQRLAWAVLCSNFPPMETGG